jgi:hypothetical protein
MGSSRPLLFVFGRDRASRREQFRIADDRLAGLVPQPALDAGEAIVSNGVSTACEQSLTSARARNAGLGRV